MNRRGMALLIVLWLLVALVGATGVTLAALRSGERASRNRLALARGAWAAEACLAVARARYAGGATTKHSAPALGLDSIDLGSPIWCRLTVEAPDTRVPLNSAGPAMLRAALAGRREGGQAGGRDGGRGDSLLAIQLLQGRPWPDLAALRGLSGCDSSCAAELEGRFTVRGSGRIDPNTAPFPVLAALPGMDRAGTEAILGARRGGVVFHESEQLIAILPAASRTAVLGDFPGFIAATEWTPSELVLHLEGHAGADAPVAQITVTVIPLTDRLAITRREIR